MSAAQTQTPRTGSVAPLRTPVNAAQILRRAMPPWRRFWPGAASGFLTEASAVALLACSAWLIVYASEQPPVMFLGAAVVGVRAFALSRAAFRYTERLASHDAALRQLAQTRTDLVRRVMSRLRPLVATSVSIHDGQQDDGADERDAHGRQTDCPG